MTTFDTNSATNHANDQYALSKQTARKLIAKLNKLVGNIRVFDAPTADEQIAKTARRAAARRAADQLLR